MPVSEYTPTVTSVAAFLRARTKTRGGQEAGTFNPEASDDRDRTRPSAEQVAEEISNALPDISGIIGVDIAEEHWDLARRVASLRTALLIELTYFPEQVATGRSPYAQLKDLYDEYWGNLLSAMGLDEDGDGIPDSGGVGGGLPSYGGFPTTAIGMETAW